MFPNLYPLYRRVSYGLYCWRNGHDPVEGTCRICWKEGV